MPCHWCTRCPEAGGRPLAGPARQWVILHQPVSTSSKKHQGLAVSAPDQREGPWGWITDPGFLGEGMQGGAGRVSQPRSDTADVQGSPGAWIPPPRLASIRCYLQGGFYRPQARRPQQPAKPRALLVPRRGFLIPFSAQGRWTRLCHLSMEDPTQASLGQRPGENREPSTPLKPLLPDVN